ncbi:MAG: hypothetical protein ACTHJU_04085 [Sphingopyxis sp.]
MNLNEEMQQAVSDVGQRHIDALLGAGVPPASLAGLGQRQMPFGVAMVCHGDDRLWWPDDGGTPHLIIPCYERGKIVDLIAMKPSRPDVWFHRNGLAVLLGADLLSTCVKDFALELVTTPLDWLASGGDAVCVLNWAAPFHELSPLRDWPELRVDTVRLSRAVRQYLSRPNPIPKITLNLKETYRDAA